MSDHDNPHTHIHLDEWHNTRINRNADSPRLGTVPVVLLTNDTALAMACAILSHT
jgi:hypothetical protein